MRNTFFDNQSISLQVFKTHQKVIDGGLFYWTRFKIVRLVQLLTDNYISNEELKFLKYFQVIYFPGVISTQNTSLVPSWFLVYWEILYLYGTFQLFRIFTLKLLDIKYEMYYLYYYWRCTFEDNDRIKSIISELFISLNYKESSISLHWSRLVFTAGCSVNVKLTKFCIWIF